MEFIKGELLICISRHPDTHEPFGDPIMMLGGNLCSEFYLEIPKKTDFEESLEIENDIPNPKKFGRVTNPKFGKTLYICKIYKCDVFGRPIFVKGQIWQTPSYHPGTINPITPQIMIDNDPVFELYLELPVAHI